MTDVVDRLRETSGLTERRIIAERKEAADEIERLRVALREMIDMNEGERICAYSSGQEYYKRCFDIARAALAHDKEITP